MKIGVYFDGELARVWDCEEYEERGQELWVLRSGKWEKAVNLGNYGHGEWWYELL